MTLSLFKQLLLSITIALSPFSPLYSTIGKIDLAPTFVHIDVLESGKTTERMDVFGGRLDISYFIYHGLYVKPTTLLATSGEGNLATASLGLGYYIPITEKIALAPSIGYTYSYINTYIDLENFGLKDLKETFQSSSPYIGLEVYYKPYKDWRVVFSLQYAWSRTHTHIEDLIKSKDHCQGPNYAFLIEKDLTKNFSTNIGLGYNLSLSKEKHGIRGYGIKWGFAYWF